MPGSENSTLADVAPSRRYAVVRSLAHYLVDRVPMGALLWCLRHLPHTQAPLRTETREIYPSIDGELHAPILIDAVERAGGYRTIARTLTWLNRYRFSYRAAAVLAGARLFEERADIQGPTPPKGAIVVVPHLGLPFLHQAHFLALGHKVLFPVYDPDGRFGDQWRAAERLGRMPGQAVLRIAHLPDPLFAFRAKRALEQGFTFTWQPDTFFRGERAKKPVVVSMLGRPMSVSPLVEKLAVETSAPVFIANNKLAADGRRVDMNYFPVPLLSHTYGDFTRQLYQCVDVILLNNISQWSQWRSYAAFMKAS